MKKSDLIIELLSKFSQVIGQTASIFSEFNYNHWGFELPEENANSSILNQRLLDLNNSASLISNKTSDLTQATQDGDFL